MTKRRKSRIASKPRHPVNAVSSEARADPASWGGANPLPGGKTRRVLMPIWERLLRSEHYPWFTHEMKQAGDEIERIFTGISGGLMPRSQLGSFSGASGCPSIAPDSPASERMIAAWRDRYQPWAKAMADHKTASGKPVMAFIIDLCVEDMTIRECERYHGLTNGSGPELIQYGLGRYVEMARW